MPSNHNDENDQIAFIGERFIYGGTEPFGFSRVDRRQHVYLIGKTGAGKTTLLRNLILQDIDAGEGVAVIDPHGDLAQDLIDHIPRWRTDHVTYFNPSDYENPIAINFLANVPRDKRHAVASGIVGAFKSIWRDSWGPRLEYLLHAAIGALLECQNVSLLGVQRILVDDSYRQWVLRQVTDPAIRAFWLREFAGYDKRFAAEVIAPAQNKIGQLLMAAPIRNILGQVKSKVDLRFVMDHRRIFIANLSKGLLGEDKANLLGAFLVSQFQHAAMARASVSEDQRADFHLFVDEFHNFTTDSFASILSEARKYRLGMVLSHQYTAQLRPEIRDAVFGNVGTLISFRVGESDAVLIEREFGGVFPGRTFTDLANHEICVRILHDGQPRDPFLAKTFPPLDLPGGRRDAIIRRSRERFSTPRAVVEDRIRRWLSRDTPAR